MKPVQTISDVIDALDVIIKDCAQTQSRAGYFAALYKRMTVAVSNGIQTAQFEDGPRMESLDVVFANRYLDAYRAFQRGEECTSSWQGAFTGCGNPSLVVLQQLILGINTHINLDLAIAAAQVAPGDSIHALKPDFDHINAVISSLVDDVQKCLEEVWLPMRFFRNIVNKQGEPVLNFSIGIARKAAWENAEKLAYMKEAERSAHIKKMDGMVRLIGDRIINPGFWPALLLRLVRLTEFDDVARTIHLIDTTVVEADQTPSVPAPL